jgi:transcriptional regulator with XRE-family HTH domain
MHDLDRNPAAEDTIGGRISLGREAAGISVEEAALCLGVLTESWDAWERDRALPRMNRLTMMAGLLSVSPSWLLAGVGTGPIPQAADKDVHLFRIFKQTSEEVAQLNQRMKSIETRLAQLVSAIPTGNTADLPRYS